MLLRLEPVWLVWRFKTPLILSFPGGEKGRCYSLSPKLGERVGVRGAMLHINREDFWGMVAIDRVTEKWTARGG
jgi:hypothetical protein